MVEQNGGNELCGDLAIAKRNAADLMMGPIFKALRVREARDLAPVECICGECGDKFSSDFPSKQCRKCRQAEYRAFDRERL